jgi:uncharacterized protein (DUF302 family)
MNTAKKFAYSRMIEKDPEYVMKELFTKLKNESWIVLSYVDVREIIEKNSGKSFKPYYIINVCRPQAAVELLDENYDLGIFLPCKIVLRLKGNNTEVSLLLVSESDRNYLGGTGKTAEKYENELETIISSIGLH